MRVSILRGYSYLLLLQDMIDYGASTVDMYAQYQNWLAHASAGTAAAGSDAPALSQTVAMSGSPMSEEVNDSGPMAADSVAQGQHPRTPPTVMERPCSCLTAPSHSAGSVDAT
jgi:hypothetical protein